MGLQARMKWQQGLISSWDWALGCSLGFFAHFAPFPAGPPSRGARPLCLMKEDRLYACETLNKPALPTA